MHRRRPGARVDCGESWQPCLDSVPWLPRWHHDRTARMARARHFASEQLGQVRGSAPQREYQGGAVQRDAQHQFSGFSDPILVRCCAERSGRCYGPDDQSCFWKTIERRW
jgi:hypothetical protein